MEETISASAEVEDQSSIMMDEAVQTEDLEGSASATLMELARGSMAAIHQPSAVTPLFTEVLRNTSIPKAVIVDSPGLLDNFESVTPYDEAPSSLRLAPQQSELLSQVSPLVPQNVGSYEASRSLAEQASGLVDVIDSTTLGSRSLMEAQEQPILEQQLFETSPTQRMSEDRQAVEAVFADDSFQQDTAHGSRMENQYGQWQSVNTQSTPESDYRYSANSMTAPEQEFVTGDPFEQEAQRRANLTVEPTLQYPDPEDSLLSPWQTQQDSSGLANVGTDIRENHGDLIDTPAHYLGRAPPDAASRPQSRESELIDLISSNEDEEESVTSSTRLRSNKEIAPECGQEEGGYEDGSEEEFDGESHTGNARTLAALDRREDLGHSSFAESEVDEVGDRASPYSDEEEYDEEEIHSSDDEAYDEQGNSYPPGFRSINRRPDDAEEESDDERSRDYDDEDDVAEEEESESQTQPRSNVPKSDGQVISLLSSDEEDEQDQHQLAADNLSNSEEWSDQEEGEDQSDSESEDDDKNEEMPEPEQQQVFPSVTARDESEALSDGEMADDDEPGDNFQQEGMAGADTNPGVTTSRPIQSSPISDEGDGSDHESHGFDNEVADTKNIPVIVPVGKVEAVENTHVGMEDRPKSRDRSQQHTTVQKPNLPAHGFDGASEEPRTVETPPRSSPPVSIFSNIARITQAMSVKSSPPRPSLFSKVFSIDGANYEPESRVGYPRLPSASPPREVALAHAEAESMKTTAIAKSEQLPTPAETQVPDDMVVQEHVDKAGPILEDQTIELVTTVKGEESLDVPMIDAATTKDSVVHQSPTTPFQQTVGMPTVSDATEQEDQDVIQVTDSPADNRAATPETQTSLPAIPVTSPRRSHRRVRSTSKALALQEAVTASLPRASTLHKDRSSPAVSIAEAEKHIMTQDYIEPLITRASLRSASPGVSQVLENALSSESSKKEGSQSRRSVEPSITRASLRSSSPKAANRKENMSTPLPATPVKTKHTKKGSIDKTSATSSVILDQPATPTGHDASMESALSLLNSPEHDLRSRPIDRKTSLIRNLHTKLESFKSLKVLRYELGKKLDVLAIATSAPAAAERAKNGPRHYLVTFNVTDPSIAPTGVAEVQILRPYKEALPIINVGDGVLLRNFAVLALKSKGFGLRSDSESGSWAVFKSGEEIEVKGPPVEFGETERNHVMEMKMWYENLDDESVAKMRRANGIKGNA